MGNIFRKIKQGIEYVFEKTLNVIKSIPRVIRVVAGAAMIVGGVVLAPVTMGISVGLVGLGVGIMAPEPSINVNYEWRTGSSSSSNRSSNKTSNKSSNKTSNETSNKTSNETSNKSSKPNIPNKPNIPKTSNNPKNHQKYVPPTWHDPEPAGLPPKNYVPPTWHGPELPPRYTPPSVNIEHSTINGGTPFVSSGMLVNNNAIVVGNLTNGPEIMMLTRAFTS